MSIEWQRPLEGGLLIGAAVATLAIGRGEIAGVSGLFGRVIAGQWGDHAWRALFLLGLVLPGLVAPVGAVQQAGGLAYLAIAGLLVGIGTRLGGGCTSGHGVCGIARLSLRSLVATLVFMATAMATLYVVRHGAVR